MGYAVVQFTKWKNGTSVLAIPESWIFEKGKQLMCYFPWSNAQKLIEKEATPRGDWIMYEVRRLSTSNISSYEKAHKTESEARFTSEVDTNSESGGEHPQMSDVEENTHQCVKKGVEHLKAKGLLLASMHSVTFKHLAIS
jgi:hypothetical protein